MANIKNAPRTKDEMHEQWDDRRTAAKKAVKKKGATWITYAPDKEAKKAIRKAVVDGAGLDAWLDKVSDYEGVTISVKYSTRERAWKCTLHEEKYKYNEGVYLCGYHSLPSIAIAVALYGLIEKYKEFPRGNVARVADLDW